MNPQTPASLPYTPMVDASGRPILNNPYTPSRILGRVGQNSQYTQERMRMMHGRYLSGLGQEPQVGPAGADPGYDENLLPNLEKDDDCFGSGIFDQPGSRPTSNQDMGVFTSDYALPGYVAREVPYAVSQDVSDVIEGGEVVYIPGGGFYHTEFDTRRIPSPVLGDRIVAAPNVPAPLSTIAQPIVSMAPAATSGLDPIQYGRQPSYRPAREPAEMAPRVRAVPAMTPLQKYPPMQPLPYKYIVEAVGQDSSTPASAGTMAAYGLILGAAVGLVVGALKAKPAPKYRNNRRRRHAR